jgi:hypothetical protein
MAPACESREATENRTTTAAIDNKVDRRGSVLTEIVLTWPTEPALDRGEQCDSSTGKAHVSDEWFLVRFKVQSLKRRVKRIGKILPGFFPMYRNAVHR